MIQHVTPPPSWTLAGNAVGILRLIDRRIAETYVPAGVKVVVIWPGKTLGGILLASYGDGSTLKYNELIVFCAVVRRGWRIGGWVSHIYVDDPASVAGGREIWGLPKESAEFDLSEESVVTQGESVLLRLISRAGHVKLPVLFRLRAWSIRGNMLTSFVVRGRGRTALGFAGWEVPADNPLSKLISSGAGFCVRLTKLRLTVPAPQAGRAEEVS